MKPIKAIALMSGGLDSALAAKLVKDQGIEVIGLHLSSPFACRTDIEKCAADVGVPLIFREKGQAYIDLLENPRYGYGKNMNPCIDCRIFMFEMADVVRQDEGADFIVTGEVLGQRPMSQRRDSMDVIDRDSKMKGLILRPLSAHKFPPTVPEEKGWVDRAKLLNISGRGRSDQLKLVEELGLQDYSSPGGGCLLTETSFHPRLKDFFENEDKEKRLKRSELLRYGRHFRLGEKTKVIIGRREDENSVLAEKWKHAEGTLFQPVGFAGPSAVAFGDLGEGERNRIGEMILRYSKVDLQEKKPLIRFQSEKDSGEIFVGKRISDEQLEQLRIA